MLSEAIIANDHETAQTVIEALIGSGRTSEAWKEISSHPIPKTDGWEETIRSLYTDLSKRPYLFEDIKEVARRFAFGVQHLGLTLKTFKLTASLIKGAQHEMITRMPGTEVHGETYQIISPSKVSELVGMVSRNAVSALAAEYVLGHMPEFLTALGLPSNLLIDSGQAQRIVMLLTADDLGVNAATLESLRAIISRD
jgi:hypothetical protein